MKVSSLLLTKSLRLLNMPCGFPGLKVRRRDSAVPRDRLNQINSQLYNLPLEIFLMIYSYLDQPDLYCLSVATSRWRRTLNDQMMTPLHMSRSDQLELMNRNTRQDPSRFYCQVCRKRHYYRQLIPPGVRRGQLPSLECQQPDKILLHVQLPSGPAWAFYFTHLQLSMDEHFWPGTGLSLRSLETIIVHERHVVDAPTTGGAQLTSIDARIIDDELYLRVQMWVASDPANPQDTLVEICNHKGLNPKSMQLFMSTMNWYAGITDTVPNPQAGDGLGSHELWVCARCKVECVIQSKNLNIAARSIGSAADGSQRTYIVITKYLALGRGRSPTDNNCWRHRGWGFKDVILSNGSKHPRLMQVYENEGKGLDLGAITRSNEQVLTQATYSSPPFVKCEYEPSKFCWIRQNGSNAGHVKRRSTISRIKARLST